MLEASIASSVRLSSKAYCKGDKIIGGHFHRALLVQAGIDLTKARGRQADRHM